MMQYMSIGKAEAKLAHMKKQLKAEKADPVQCGITRQHIMYLEQNIDAYERVIKQFKETCREQRSRKSD